MDELSINQFLADLGKYEQPTSRPGTDSTMLGTHELQSLSAVFSAVEEHLDKSSKETYDSLKRKWPGNPLICRASLLEPLGIHRREIYVVKALSWLITPESKLRKESLEAFVRNALSLHENADLTAIEHPTAIEHWKVETEQSGEKGRIDLVIDGRIKNSLAICIGVEAKIDARERDRQIKNYREQLEKGREKEKVFLLFLTTDRRQAQSGERVKSISYEDIIDWLLPVLYENRNEEEAPFFQLFLSDLARELSSVHGVSGITRRSDLSIRLTTVAKKFLEIERQSA